jgi:hypothetical protein
VQSCIAFPTTTIGTTSTCSACPALPSLGP